MRALEGLWKNCVFIRKFLVNRREKKDLETFLMLILTGKNLFSPGTFHQLSTSDEKILLLTGKFEKAYLVRNFFRLPER